MQPHLNRRDLLKSASCGFGYLAFAGLATQASDSYKNPLAPKTPHFPARAKRIIFFCMRGGPSHLDTFDYKPNLTRDHGKEISRGRNLLKSPWDFRPQGESGLMISELFPHTGKHADELCIINSMHTDVSTHAEANLTLHTGAFRFARPSLGSWLLYGLGSENQDLPGYITIKPPVDTGGAQNYASGFLPAAYNGTRIGSLEEPVAKAKIGNLRGSLSRDSQRRQLDLLQAMNNELLERQQVDPEVEGVINSFELGFRMQNSLPALMDLSQESQRTLSLYGIGEKLTDDFGRQCLWARRFVESGVRFVEVSHGNWDTHKDLVGDMPRLAGNIDRPVAALLTDLQDRGLLEETLVMWGGEFGRTSHSQGATGRDHNSAGFSMWLAGGGIRGGLQFGATDEHGGKAVENPVHHHDLHATLLHLLGLDHQKLSYRFGGRDYTLTDIHGRVVREILA